MKTIVNKAKWTIDSDGAWMSFRTSNPAEARQMCDTIEKDKQYIVEVKKKTKKRSLNANGYMWQLCDKIADVLNLTKEEIYRQAIQHVGIFKDFENLSEAEAKTLRTAWEMLGTGWITEQADYMPDGEHVIIRCYYGSSKYNTKQMSRLINYIVDECKELCIETLTPSEQDLLIDKWAKEE